MAAVSFHRTAAVQLATFIFYLRAAVWWVFILSPNPLKKLIWFSGMDAWDKVSEKHPCFHLLGLELAINSKVTLRIPAIDASGSCFSRTCPGTGVIQWREPLGSVNHS